MRTSESAIPASEFDFSLPPELIAQVPAPQRDQSRLLVVQRSPERLFHRRFPDLLEYLQPGNLLVVNDSKVIPARLRGVNAVGGGEFEILLLEENSVNDWWAMLRPGKRARPDTRIILKNQLKGEPTGIEAHVLDLNHDGHRRLRFSGTPNISEALNRLGAVPLPPYVRRSGSDNLAEDSARYQTVYAARNGSVAAPTAGLHFTLELLEKIRACGIQICFVTLHVGVGTFAPVKTAHLAEHVMHEERFAVSNECAQAINLARQEGRRIVAVGTTSARVLESVAAQHEGQIVAGAGRTRLFIYPPYRFQIASALLTNFHLPRSTLLMLASAFAAPGETRGRELILSAYAEAIAERYRFFSYGDAMLMV